MFSAHEIFDNINVLWSKIFGTSPPHLLVVAVSIGIILYFGLYIGVNAIIWLNKKYQELKPIFYNEKQIRLRKERQLFATYVREEVQRLNQYDNWQEDHFTELEAEIEAEGRHGFSGFMPGSLRKGLRREKSLSKALESSKERLVLLQGEPGSGKSVALRHLAYKLASKAKKSRRVDAVIPLYINLKGLRHIQDQAIDSELIKSFVLQSVKRVGDPKLDIFLENEFEKGLKDGTWLFLFDSFDELPEVMGFSEAHATIRSYADAINDFLSGMNQCKGIIASREFRGPGQSGWPKFLILPFTEKQRLKLIHNFQLEAKQERDFIGKLGTAAAEIGNIAENPMYLSLLCEQTKAGLPFPMNTHSVFENYIESRIHRHKEYIQQAHLTHDEIRKTAENIAFCMSADLQLGLSPLRSSLERTLKLFDFNVNPNFYAVLDILEKIKIARSEKSSTADEELEFTFSHRRFQEYFATCVVLHEPTKVQPEELLSNARWRETAVVLCQTQPIEVISPIIAQARSLLNLIVNSLNGLIEDPNLYITANPAEIKPWEIKEPHIPNCVLWPVGSLHLLSLLQDGFANRLSELPEDIRSLAGRLVLSAYVKGTLFDKKWGLEVAGIVPTQVLQWMLIASFSQRSEVLSNVAYNQAARLKNLSQEICRYIYLALSRLSINGELRRQRYAVIAHLSRLEKSSDFISAANLLYWLPLINITLHVSAFVLLLPWNFPEKLWILLIIVFSGSTRKYRNSEEKGIAETISMYRFGIPFFFGIFCLSSVYSNTSSNSWLPLLLLFAFYAVCWEKSATYFAENGRFTPIFLWPLLPFLALIYSLRVGKNLLFKQSWASIYDVVWRVVLGCAIIILLAFVIVAGSTHNFFVYYLVIIIGYLFYAMVCYFYFRSFVMTAMDWFIWQKWLRNRPATLTGRELLELIKQFRIERSLVGCVVFVRERNLLLPSSETEAMLKRLGVLFEYHVNLLQFEKYNRRKGEIKIDPALELDIVSSPESVDQWFVEFMHKHRQSNFITNPAQLSKNAIYELLDEITLLLDRVSLGKA